MSISIWQAKRANSSGRSKRRRWANSAFNSAVMKLPEDPNPVPAGISASVEISSWGVLKSNIRTASRMIGCWIYQCPCFLQLGIFQKNPLDERSCHGDINISVDRGSDEKTSMLTVIGRKVSSASSKCDSKRTTCYYHFTTFRPKTTYWAPMGIWETRFSNGRRNFKKAGKIKRYRSFSNSNPLAMTSLFPCGGLIGIAFRSISACVMLYFAIGFQGLFSHNAKKPPGSKRIAHVVHSTVSFMERDMMKDPITIDEIY